LLACFLLGLSWCFITASNLFESPSFAWREFESYEKVLTIIWRDQINAVRFGFGKLGWITVLLVSYLPFVIVMIPKQTSLLLGNVLGSYALHLLLTALSVCMLFDLWLAPATLLRAGGTLVLPYLFIAAWTGYLAGYGFILLTCPMKPNPLGYDFHQRRLPWCYSLGLFGLLIGSAIWNYPQVDTRHAGRARYFSEIILEHLEGKQFLVSNGTLDDNLRLIARRREMPLTVINSALGQSGAYRKYVASLFENPRIKGLASVGLSPMIQAWVNQSENASEEMAFLSDEDVLAAHGFVVVPNKTISLAHVDLDGVDGHRLSAEHKIFWSTLAASLKAESARSRAADSPRALWNRWMARHISRLANNLGVLLEDLNEKELAFETYEKARDIYDDNVSAFLNLHSLSYWSQLRPADELDREFEAFLARHDGMFRHQLLSQVYGFIRHPEIYLKRGLLWSQYGYDRAGMASFKRAVELSDNWSFPRLAMASLFFTRGDRAASEDALLRVLNREPRNTHALWGLVRTSTFQGRFLQAREYLAQLADLGVPGEQLALEQAVLLYFEGRWPPAVSLLEDLVRTDRNNSRAWLLLLAIGVQSGEEMEKTDEHLNAVLGRERNRPEVFFAGALIQLQRGKAEDAYRLLAHTVALQPTHRRALELLLQRDLMSTQVHQTRKHLTLLLNLDPKHPLGNLALGLLQRNEGEHELAEASFRASLAAEKSPIALIELAWLLQKQDKLDDAMGLVEEAIAMNPESSASWQTKGLLDMKSGRLSEAEISLLEALRIDPENAHARLYQAMLMEKQEDYEAAVRLVDDVLKTPEALLPETLAEAERLSERLAKR
ncbi:MAG: tetratricopeptide repeat protein, partial [Verrucomicrobiota bacterium]